MEKPPSKRKPIEKETTPSADDAALGVVVTTARVAASAARALASAPGVKPLVERSAATGRAARTRGRERIETAAQSALSGPELERFVDGVIDSPEFEHALERALSSPKVREAIAHQTTSAATELADDVHRHAADLDRSLSFARARDATQFAGLVSRALAFAVDLVLAHLAFLVGATVVGLIVELVGELRPTWLFGALAGMGWVLLVGAYFVFFWTLGGQTLGMHMLRLRVVDVHGRPPTFMRAAARFVALLLSIVPMFAGFLPILFERRRRGVHDFLAGTTVLYVE